MPNCKDCAHFQEADENGIPQCLLSPWRPGVEPNYHEHKARVKACERAILLKHLDNIRGKVMEVGPGVSRFVKKKIQTHALWHGIDPVWETNPGKRGYKGKASAIPFADEYFDWVVTFSSIEHWEEHGDTIEAGLKEIHRVLKTGGKLLISFPIHNHGSDPFYYGRLVDILGRLRTVVQWAENRFEVWGKNPSPLAALQEWRIEHTRVPGLLAELQEIPNTYTVEFFASK